MRYGLSCSLALLKHDPRPSRPAARFSRCHCCNVSRRAAGVCVGGVAQVTNEEITAIANAVADEIERRKVARAGVQMPVNFGMAQVPTHFVARAAQAPFTGCAGAVVWPCYDDFPKTSVNK